MSPSPDPHLHFPAQCTFLYERQGALLHVKMAGLTNHELRNVLIGMWLTLERADQEDMLRELDHYLLPESFPPVSSQIVAKAIIDARERSG